MAPQQRHLTLCCLTHAVVVSNGTHQSTVVDGIRCYPATAVGCKGCKQQMLSRGRVNHHRKVSAGLGQLHPSTRCSKYFSTSQPLQESSLLSRLTSCPECRKHTTQCKALAARAVAPHTNAPRHTPGWTRASVAPNSGHAQTDQHTQTAGAARNLGHHCHWEQLCRPFTPCLSQQHMS